jgi:hypothetical protein
MTLEDFEKSLVDRKGGNKGDLLAPRSERYKSREKHHRHHHTTGDDRHRHKRSRHSKDSHEHAIKRHRNPSPVKKVDVCDDQPIKDDEVGKNLRDSTLQEPRPQLKRDSWMEVPSKPDYRFFQNRSAKYLEVGKEDIDSGISAFEPNQYHQTHGADDTIHEHANYTINYIFGDAGAQWRMTKLKAVFREAEESRRPIDDVALERFGDLRAFDDAREEQIELGRRETYGKGYAWKEKPSGELYRERQRDTDVKTPNSVTPEDGQLLERGSLKPEGTRLSPKTNLPMDQTALNRLKAQMMKAKLKSLPNACDLEAEFNKAMASFERFQEPDTVVLDAMENRLFTGGRKGEVNDVNTKRGRGRRLVEENEDMSIEAMIKEERRTRNEAGGDGRRFAERIAKDGKFDVMKIFSVQIYTAS